MAPVALASLPCALQEINSRNALTLIAKAEMSRNAPLIIKDALVKRMIRRSAQVVKIFSFCDECGGADQENKFKGVK